MNILLLKRPYQSVSELLKCLKDKTGCNSLKTANYPSWSGGNQKIVVCTQCENFKLRVRKLKVETMPQYWQVVDDTRGTNDKTPVTCLEHGTWVDEGPAVMSSASVGVLLKHCSYQTYIPMIAAEDLAQHPIFRRSVQDSVDSGLNADLKHLKTILVTQGKKASSDVFKKGSAIYSSR